MHLALIGYGNIARMLPAILAREHQAPSRLTVLARPESAARVAGELGRDYPGVASVVTSAGEIVAARPDIAVEAAGHDAVRDFAVPLLRAGVATVIVSAGALADDALYEGVRAAARAGHTRAIVPAGAIGGVDMLAALRASGIERLVYTGRKPPEAWRGTPAEAALDLGALREATTFYSGTARAAARDYPKNANVAATLALAGPGFERTEVRLVADPDAGGNIHEYEVTAGAGQFSIRIRGNPSPDNPKTSLTTVYSVAREILNLTGEVAI